MHRDGAIAGAGLAFLWFNAYPAEVFMGDVGALALGAALGIVALIVRQEIVLFIMAGVFVVETLSVMIQVAQFQIDRQASVPNGAAASPLRVEGLERESGRRALLDHHDDARSVWTLHIEVALMNTQARRLADLGEANLREQVKRLRGRDQNLPVRFWIITMMLVLFGLSTLKLR